MCPSIDNSIELTNKILSAFEEDSKKCENTLPETKNLSDAENADKALIIPVQIYTAGKLHYFETNSLNIKSGDAVIINTDSGTELGYAVKNPELLETNNFFPDGKIQKIIRLADTNDLKEAERALSKEKDAFDYCIEKIKSFNLDMKLVRVRYLFGCKKAIFYFTSEGRVDFRELVKDLVTKFKIRIELRQIGVRDETKLIGGIGSCGRSLCCCSMSREFPAVSIKMGKEQGLSLNPAKISGICGRLLCCLNYELSVYKSLCKGAPKVGKKCIYEGKVGKVINMNILAKKALVFFEEGGALTVNIDKLEQYSKCHHACNKDKPEQTASNKFFTELKNEFADLDILPFIEFEKPTTS